MRKSKKNSKQPEQIRISNPVPAKIEPLRPQAEQRDKPYNDLAKFPSENPYPVMRIHKDGTVMYANKASEPLLKAKDSRVDGPAPSEWHRLVENALASGRVAREEVKDNGRVFALRAVPIPESDYVNFYGTDITEQKLAENEREITIKLLSLINSKNNIHELMKLVSTLLKDWSGCEAVGIRLQDGEDFPYFETSGFPEEFILAESKLCSVNEIGELVRDSQGRPYLECMCGNIISGRFDPSKPFFTKHGSFWTNSTTELLAGTTNADRLTKTRNRCNTAGYESVALVPLRAVDQTFGLLQFNSKQRGCFTPEMISLLERLADNLAIGLAQRRAEKLLRESEDKFKTLAEEAFDSIVIHDGQRIIEANKAFCRLWGYDPKEAVGLKIDKFFAPEGWEDAKKRIQSGYDRPYEANTIRKDGTRFQVEIAGKTITYKGKTVRIATARDITERKQAEQALYESEERLKAALDAAELGIWDWDLVHGHIEWEGHHTRLFGFKKGEFDGRYETFEKRIHPDDIAELNAAVEKAKKEKSEYFCEYRVIWPDGTVRWISGKGRCQCDDAGRAVRMLGTVQDITKQKKAVESLHTSETRFRELFKNISSGVAVYEAVDDGSDFVFRDFNAAGQRMDKTSKEDAVGKRVTEVFPGVKEMGLWDVFRRVWKTGKAEQHPTTFYKDERISGWRENYVYKLPSGEIVAVYDDVTERQAALERLQDERNLLRTLIDHIPDKVYVKDKDSRFVVCNKTTSKYWEAAGKGNLIGKTDFDLFEPAQAQIYFDEEQKLMRTGKPIINIGDRYTDYAGVVRYVLTSKVPLLDSHGGIMGLVGIHRDITERRLMEERLQDERNLLRTLIDHIPDDVYVKDKDSRFIICNKAVTGYWDTEGKSNIIGMTDFDLFEPATAQEYFDEEQKIMQTGQSLANMERQITDKTGSVHHCMTTKLPLRDNSGNIVGLVGINRDTTERKKAEQKLLDNQQRLKRLAAQLALAEERERRRIAGELHDNVNQSLALAKIKLDSLHAALSSQPMAGVIEDISGSIEQAIQDTRTLTFDLSNPILYELGFEAAVSEWLDENVRVKHKINTEFQDDGRDKLLDDDMRALLFRNVRELLINTIKYANADKVRVSVRRIDGSIEIIVEDNGVGFDPVEVRTLASKRAEFGLLSVHESLEQLGGHFEIESKPGAGCKATMTAPLKGQSRKKED